MRRGRPLWGAAAVCAAVLLGACGDDGPAAPGATDADEVPVVATPGPLSLVDPVTDNYKACYNADPDAPEPRTWLTLAAVEVDGVRYADPPDGVRSIEDGLPLTAPDGTQATLRASADDAAATVALRAQARRFGPLITVADLATLPSAPVTVEVVLEVDGDAVATARVAYRHDPEVVAAAGPGTLEHNGPGGRWVVAEEATPMNWEAEGTGPAC